MLTRKDMIAAAKTVAALESAKERLLTARVHVTLFRASNPRFDLVRFAKACNVQASDL
jgi:capsule polysaccharide export protein KpsE/RkpR